MKSYRKNIVRILARKFWKVPEGQRLPNILLIIAYILFPSRIIWDFNPWFRYDFMSDTITIGKKKIRIQELIDLAEKEK